MREEHFLERTKEPPPFLALWYTWYLERYVIQSRKHTLSQPFDAHSFVPAKLIAKKKNKSLTVEVRPKVCCLLS